MERRGSQKKIFFKLSSCSHTQVVIKFDAFYLLSISNFCSSEQCRPCSPTGIATLLFSPSNPLPALLLVLTLILQGHTASFFENSSTVFHCTTKFKLFSKDTQPVTLQPLIPVLVSSPEWPQLQLWNCGWFLLLPTLTCHCTCCSPLLRIMPFLLYPKQILLNIIFSVESFWSPWSFLLLLSYSLCCI